MNQARELGATIMEVDIQTGANITFRAQALELAFESKRNGATKEELAKIFESFKLVPEEI